jgi:hypothetical protein
VATQAAALAAAAEGMTLREGLAGMEEGEALLGLALADALEATGDRAGAEAAFRQAHERILARAGRIADPAWRESFLRRVPENALVASALLPANRMGPGPHPTT